MKNLIIALLLTLVSFNVSANIVDMFVYKYMQYKIKTNGIKYYTQPTNTSALKEISNLRSLRKKFKKNSGKKLNFADGQLLYSRKKKRLEFTSSNLKLKITNNDQYYRIFTDSKFEIFNNDQEKSIKAFAAKILSLFAQNSMQLCKKFSSPYCPPVFTSKNEHRTARDRRAARLNFIGNAANSASIANNLVKYANKFNHSTRAIQCTSALPIKAQALRSIVQLKHAWLQIDGVSYGMPYTDNRGYFGGESHLFTPDPFIHQSPLDVKCTPILFPKYLDENEFIKKLSCITKKLSATHFYQAKSNQGVSFDYHGLKNNCHAATRMLTKCSEAKILQDPNLNIGGNFEDDQEFKVYQVNQAFNEQAEKVQQEFSNLIKNEYSPQVIKSLYIDLERISTNQASRDFPSFDRAKYFDLLKSYLDFFTLDKVQKNFFDHRKVIYQDICKEILNNC
jgi:hypothetical protein